MKYRISKIFLCIFLISVFSIGLFSCSDTPACSDGSRKHDFSAWKEDTATCTESGTQTRSCRTCGYAETRETTAVGHTLEVKEAKAATCTEIGYNAYKYCIKCDYKEGYAEIAAVGHDKIDVARKPATCEEVGHEAYVGCSKCDYTENYVEIAALGHDRVYHPEKPSTCAEEGYNAYTECTRCDYTTYLAIAKSDHVFGPWRDATATCTTAGSETRYCENCDYSESRTVAALGHNMITHEGKAATCTESGYAPYETCTRCDYTTYSEIECPGHIYTDVYDVVRQTCLESGTAKRDCSVCGITEDVVLPPKGHNFAPVRDNTATCTEGGTGTYYCLSCHVEEKGVPTEPLGHEYGEAHDNTATCLEAGTAKQTCQRENCGYVDTFDTEALGHDIEQVEGKPASCEEPGYGNHERCKREGCEYTTAKYTDPLGHQLGIVEKKDATCSEEGYEEYNGCIRCNYVEGFVAIPKIDHTLTQYEAKAATCTEKGHLAYEECSVCDYTTYKETPITHQYENQSGMNVCTVCGELEASDGLAFTLSDDGTYYIVKAHGTHTLNLLGVAWRPIIPGSYNGLPVKAIADSGFAGQSDLFGIIWTENITEIGDNAFANSTISNEYIGLLKDGESISGVSAFSYVTKIGKNIFANCPNVKTETESGITYYGNIAISADSSLPRALFREGTTLIADYILDGAMNLTEVTIPESVKYVGEGAFRNCRELKTVNVLSTSATFYAKAFFYSDSIEAVNIDSIEAWLGNTFNTAASNPLNYAKALYINGELVKELVIPESITEIKKNAFIGLEGLVAVYYGGTGENWVKAIASNTDMALENATVYFFSEVKPEAEGNYWHYVEGKVTVWEPYVAA